MNVLAITIACGICALIYGIWAGQRIISSSAGSDKMKQIATAIQEGATAYLNRQYSTITIVGIVVTLILFFSLGLYVSIGFVLGAVLSGIAGYIGMNVSVRANVRTTEAAKDSIVKALDIAFKSGAITGMLVVGLGILGVAGYYWYLSFLKTVEVDLATYLHQYLHPQYLRGHKLIIVYIVHHNRRLDFHR